MSDPITISAKDLGSLAMPDFRARCFWTGMHAEGFPYQVFPAVFSSINSYCKRVVHGWFDRHQEAPQWLACLGTIKGYINPPHYSQFRFIDPAANVILRGVPDGILIMQDGSHVIVDYKTAKFTAHQDKLFPMYEVQLNAYAVIGEQRGISPISGLALIYTEPLADHDAAKKDSNQMTSGFVMEFSARVRPVDLAPDTHAKLTQFLLQWADKHGQETADGLRITLHMTHEEIARNIGASRESVSRILSDWKQRGVIRVSGGSVTIPNPKEFREAMAPVRSR